MCFCVYASVCVFVCSSMCFCVCVSVYLLVFVCVFLVAFFCVLCFSVCVSESVSACMIIDAIMSEIKKMTTRKHIHKIYMF